MRAIPLFLMFPNRYIKDTFLKSSNFLGFHNSYFPPSTLPPQFAKSILNSEKKVKSWKFSLLLRGLNISYVLPYKPQFEKILRGVEEQNRWHIGVIFVFCNAEDWTQGFTHAKQCSTTELYPSPGDRFLKSRRYIILSPMGIIKLDIICSLLRANLYTDQSKLAFWSPLKHK